MKTCALIKRWLNCLLIKFRIIIVFTVLLLSGEVIGQVSVESRPRTIVTTDGEVDDMDSFIRFLLYSNEFDIAGLIYTSSEFHYAGDGRGTLFTSEMPMAKGYGTRSDLRWTGTDWMQNLIDSYSAIYPNLIKHDRRFPTAAYLKSIIKTGNIDFEGEMTKNTEGSDFIKNILLDNNPAPVYVQTWGGSNTLARALKSIEDDYKTRSNWPEIYKRVSDKTIIYIILDQDATYKKYVAQNWPEIRVIYNSSQFWSLAYPWPYVVPDTIKKCLEGPWFKENIKFNHGTLLEKYYCWGDGQKITGDPDHIHGDIKEAEKQKMQQYSFISEGDSPSYFYLINFGLRNIEDPSFGGLGGRFVPSSDNKKKWEDGKNIVDFDPYTLKNETSFPQVRWISTLQNDFAARADWCVSDYKNANHAPVVTLKLPKNISAKTGSTVRVKCAASDPDGNHLDYKWWQYIEAGTYPGKIAISGSNAKNASVTIPFDAEKGSTIHLIIEVSDNGFPVLTRYQRVIITVQ